LKSLRRILAHRPLDKRDELQRHVCAELSQGLRGLGRDRDDHGRYAGTTERHLPGECVVHHGTHGVEVRARI
jgi:hypothetical protein